jgi:2-amino-4-hydroxy-6-hydroxymethyldihydropteridine diphosphokinase
MSSTAYIALGSNLGDRRATLEQAVAQFATVGAVRRVSTFIETDPVGGPAGQPLFLNGVLEVEIELAPDALLEALQVIELKLGRVRAVKDGPRTLDLDLLLYEDLILEDRQSRQPLIVPHPRLQDRTFVLEPLVEIAAERRHPVFGRTMAELLTRLRSRQMQHPEPGRELVGLRVLVAGSTSGIGRAIALELARAGADVLIHGRRSQSAADEVASECRSFGVQSDVFLADVSEASATTDLVDRAWRHWDGLDAWIHNAGADTLTGSAAHWSFEEKFDVLWQTDVQGTILATRRIGQRMKDRGQGILLTMGWDQADTGMEGDSGQLFAATKGAVMAFTRSLALSLAPEVRVNCLAPGWIRTSWGEKASAMWQERVRRETPLGVWGEPQDIASVARWLVSPAARYVTGQTIRINGGAVRS